MHLKPKWLTAAALLALLFFALPPETYAQDNAPSCRGTDLLSEMQAKSPDRYRQVVEDARKVPNAEAILWKVEKDGIPPSYLFGTMHLSDPRITVLSPRVTSAIAQSKTIALELQDLSNTAMADAMTKAAPLIGYTDGGTLSTKLSAADYKKTEQAVIKAGLPGQAAAVLRPWLVSLLLATSDCERQQMASGATALDLHIAAEAKKHNLPIVGLETIEGQFAALASVPEDQQLTILRFDLKNAERANDLMETLVQLYTKRQIGTVMPLQLALAAEVGVPASAFDGFKKNLLTDRNAGMVEKAEPLIAKGNAFIAIGALHLTGEKGVIALLREHGFTVTAIE